MFIKTSMRDSTENCQYPELGGDTQRLELTFAFPLEHVAELMVLGERMSTVAVAYFGIVRKSDVALQQIIIFIPVLKNRYVGSVPSE